MGKRTVMSQSLDFYDGSLCSELLVPSTFPHPKVVQKLSATPLLLLLLAICEQWTSPFSNLGSFCISLTRPYFSLLDYALIRPHSGSFFQPRVLYSFVRLSNLFVVATFLLFLG